MSEIDQEIIYDEANVPPYALPELLATDAGTPIADRAAWQAHRRPEILTVFRNQMYGETPAKVPPLHVEEQSITHGALDGLATSKQVGLRIGDKSTGTLLNLLIYLPAQEQPASNDSPTTGIAGVPLFVGLNFNGNHTVHADPTILISEAVVASGKETESARGQKTSSWAIEEILKRGYGVATIYCGDLAIDDEGLWQQRAFAQVSNSKAERGPSTWGAIGVWAWGLSRAMDYFEQDEDIDEKRVAVIGHSRLGKTALWAGAQDERFRMVISNNSGCGGAALSRRCFGETVSAINTRFPHWFCQNFRQYNGNEAALPMDQHMLLALIAPRPLYVASAEDDLWADPRGEFLGIKHASPVYELFGQEGLPVDGALADAQMPEVNQPVVGSIGYHCRTGGHEVTLYDWKRYMDFADRYL